MNVFLFPWVRGDRKRSKSLHDIVLFTADDNINPDWLANEINITLVDSRIGGIVILCFVFNKVRIELAISDSRFRDRLILPFRSRSQLPISILAIDESGNARDSGGGLISKTALHSLFECGAFSIFQSRNPIMQLPTGFHFKKPSSKEHASHFVRVAAALVEGVEIQFLAAAFLRFLGEDTTSIICDTSSISAVAFAAQLLLMKLSHKGKDFHISSFGSYEFDSSKHLNPLAIYLVSVSTGGRLLKTLKSRGVENQAIVTLYFEGDSKAISSPLVCDLRHVARRHPLGKECQQIEIFQDSDCPLCRDHSFPVAVTGDQLVPFEPKIEQILLKKKHRPSWMENFMCLAQGTGAIRAHHGAGKQKRIHEMYLHANSLIRDSPSFIKKLNQIISQCAPFNADRIYCCDDPGSYLLAELIESRMTKLGLKKPTRVNLLELKQDHEKLKRTHGTSLVVAGLLCSGHNLNQLSRLLREVENQGSVSFLIATRRTITFREQESMCSNLTVTDPSRASFALNSVCDIFMADSTIDHESVWKKESEFLNVFRDNVKLSSHHELQIEERLETIDRALGTDVGGMENGLFWPSPKGKPLTLSPNFSLFRAKSSKQVSQAEVYFCFSVLLHHLREIGVDGERIVNGAHHRTLIDPHSFRRFGDGVAQASILRTAHPNELCYEISPKIDNEAAEVFTSIIEQNSNHLGEAACEILLAIGLKRLRMSAASRALVLQAAVKVFNRSTIERRIAEYLLGAGV